VDGQKQTAVQARDLSGEQGVLFVCPICHGALERKEVEQEQGTLRCPTHGNFPMVEGIRSFLPAQSVSFERHWEQNELSDIPTIKLQVAREFLVPLNEFLRRQGRCTVLDAGCGDGVHLKVLTDEASALVQYVGLDVALSALIRARARSHRSWTPVHADLLALPFPGNSFDGTFSFGVIAYTEDWRRALQELIRVTKAGGLIGLWSYPKPRGLLGLCLRVLRGLTGVLPAFLQARVADLLVPFLSFLPTRSGITLRNSTWAECREVVLVTIAPHTLDFPTAESIQFIAANLGCHMLPPSPQPPITVWLQKNRQRG
jgi:SAM-dependent methyltransferase